MTTRSEPSVPAGPPALPAGALAAASWRRGRSRQGLDRRIELAVPAPGVTAVRAVTAPTGPYLVFDDVSWTAFLRPDRRVIDLDRT